jgi:sensor histidine kinase YesM
MLELGISDNGVGSSSGDTPITEGVGLGTTRARLQHLYGTHHRLELERPQEGGFRVTLTIPFRAGAERDEESAT